MNIYSGELIALSVAVSWTITALFAETASKRIGALCANIIRMGLALVLLSILLWFTTGYPYPTFTDKETWIWLAASGLTGYAFGDTCLFNSYLIIGSRFGKLMMTLSSVFAAVAGYFILGETLSWKVLVAMAVTLTGIAISVLGRKEGDKSATHSGIKLKLPLKGILLGIGAALGQGVGLVLSKQGLLHYGESVGDNQRVLFMMPFAGTFIRAIFGLISFLLIAMIQRQLGTLKRAFNDKKGLRDITLATVFGPFIGVSLSLMAVEYTSTGIAQTIMALTPVLILLPARIFYHQKITGREVLGAIISVLGVSMFFIL